MANVLAELRALCPDRPLTTPEALRIAELQALRFLSLHGLQEPPVPETLISNLPRFQVTRLSPLPFAGASRWKAGVWQIVINGSDPLVRGRFTLAHELKHIIDAPFQGKLYPPEGFFDRHGRTEQICDFFAASLLMPKVWIRRSWTTETQNLRSLARRYEVSLQAMQTRLVTLGLVDPTPRHSHPSELSKWKGGSHETAAETFYRFGPETRGHVPARIDAAPGQSRRRARGLLDTCAA